MLRCVLSVCLFVAIQCAATPPPVPSELVLDFDGLSILEEDGTQLPVTVFYKASTGDHSAKRRIQEHVPSPFQSPVYLDRYDERKKCTLYGQLCFCGPFLFDSALPVAADASFGGYETINGRNASLWKHVRAVEGQLLLSEVWLVPHNGTRWMAVPPQPVLCCARLAGLWLFGPLRAMASSGSCYSTG